MLEYLHDLEIYGKTSVVRNTTRSAVVAGNIRAELARRHLTQQDLADHLGVSAQAVSRRMRGDVPFDVDQLFTVSALLDVPVARLLDLADAA